MSREKPPEVAFPSLQALLSMDFATVTPQQPHPVPSAGNQLDWAPRTRAHPAKLLPTFKSRDHPAHTRLLPDDGSPGQVQPHPAGVTIRQLGNTPGIRPTHPPPQAAVLTLRCTQIVLPVQAAGVGRYVLEPACGQRCGLPGTCTSFVLGLSKSVMATSERSLWTSAATRERSFGRNDRFQLAVGGARSAH